MALEYPWRLVFLITAMSKMAIYKAKIQSQKFKRISEIFLACSVLLAAPNTGTTYAAGVKHAKHLYVPPTTIERRVDYSSINEYSAASDGTIITPAVKTKLRATITKLGEISKSPAVTEFVAKARAKAEQLIKEGKLQEAQKVISEALNLSPNDQVLLKQAARISISHANDYLKNHNFDEAVITARKALSEDPKNPNAHKIINQALAHLSTSGKGATVESALKAADLFSAQGLNEEASAEFRTSLRIKPNAEAHIGLGNLALRENNKTQALNEYEQALQINPKSSDAYRQIGLLYNKEGKVVDASSALNKALTIAPSDSAAGKALIELWQHQVAQDPSPNSRLGLARAYMLTGNFQAAQAEYKEVAHIDPNHPSLPSARKAFKLAVAKQQADHDLQVAHVLESQGAINEAYQKVQEAGRLNPYDENIGFYHGQLLEKLGQINQARETYINVLKVNPNHAAAAKRLGELKVSARVIDPAAQTGADQTMLANFPGGSAASILPSMIIPTDPHKISTDAHVAGLSNFANSLRGSMFVEKQKVEDFERNIRRGLDAMTAPPSAAAEEAVAHAPAASGSVLAANTSVAGSDMAGIIASASKPLPATPAISEDKLAAILAKAKEATKSAGVTSAAQAPRVIASAPQNAAENAAAFEMPPVAPDMAALHPPIPIAQSPIPQSIQRVAEFMPSSSTVHLELESVKPSANSVSMNVVLRNDSSSAIEIPANLKAIIKYSNQHESKVHAIFASNIVPAHGRIFGTIRVPMSKVDPSADLILPDLLPRGIAYRDVHLTTSMASR